jgi:hypothetical protein
MAQIGPIPVPDIQTSATPFPLIPDWGWQEIREPRIVVHQFEADDGRTEQRFYLGDGARRFVLRFGNRLRANNLDALKAFWRDLGGPYGQFIYNAPNPNGIGTTQVLCRFADSILSWQQVADNLASAGLSLVELPTTIPDYPVAGTVDRFPDVTLEAQLAASVQTIIPLVTITTRNPAYTICLSDRTCTIGGVFYHPRLLDRSDITQSLGNESDSASFTLGNADWVFAQLAEQVDLFHAALQFSAYHVQSQQKIDIWHGDIVRWHEEASGTFQVQASDGIYELALFYPSRRASQTCWKRYKDGINCTVSAPQLDCGKSWKDCQDRNNGPEFGGIYIEPQPVVVRDNSQRGRPSMTSTSIIGASIYNQPIQEVYTDEEMPVQCPMVAFREESEFATGLAIVSEGPITGFSPDMARHLMDGQSPHGPGLNGWRSSIGDRKNPDAFGLSQLLSGGAWGVPNPTNTGGTTWVEIRRKDAVGRQLTKISDHNINVVVSGGVKGYMWGSGDPASRTLVCNFTSPVWIMVNALLKAKGLWNAGAAEQVKHFDLDAAVATAAICADMVPKVVGDGLETQFQFKGVIAEEKPLRDWLTEIAQNFCGYYNFRNGKLRIGIRVNASVDENTAHFGIGNMLADSLEVDMLEPAFDHLTVRYGEREANWQLLNVEVYDKDHALRIYGTDTPTKAQMNLAGTCTRSQAARIGITRLRENLGGLTADEQRKARVLRFSSTILALMVDPGQVCSVTHERAPGGTTKLRVNKWRLTKDWATHFEGQTVVDSCYDMMVGPKPADVAYTPPEAPDTAIGQWLFEADAPGNGTVRLRNLVCAKNAAMVRQARFDLLYVSEARAGYTRIIGGISDSSTEWEYQGVAPKVGEYGLIGGEVFRVVAVTPEYESGGTGPWLDTGMMTVERAQWGTTAQSSPRVNSTIKAVTDNIEIEVNGGTGWRVGDPLFIPTNDPLVGEGQYVGAISGKVLTVAKPYLNTAEVGQAVYQDPRVYWLAERSEPITLSPSFWTSGTAARWVHEIQMPNCGLVAVRGALSGAWQTTPWLYRTFTAAPLYRARTLGNTRLEFVHDSVGAGISQDVCDEPRIGEASAFARAYCEMRDVAGTEMATPPAVTGVAIGPVQRSGKIVFAVGPENPPPSSASDPIPQLFDETAISITVGDGAGGTFVQLERPWKWGDHKSDGIFTLGHLVESVALHLRTDPIFGAYYSVETSGVELYLIDTLGNEGAITVGLYANIGPDGMGVFAAAEDLVRNTLGLPNPGRRYACTWANDEYESAASDLSAPSGGTAAAAWIEIQGIPVSPDPAITKVRLYATPFDDPHALFLVGEYDNGATTAVDAIQEGALQSQPAFAGQKQPETGAARVTVNRNGQPWFELRVPEGGVRSTVLDGLAIGNAAAGTVLTVDVNNQGNAAKSMRVVLE